MKQSTPRKIRKHVVDLIEALEDLGIVLDAPVTLSGGSHYRILLRKGPFKLQTFCPYSPGDKYRGMKNQFSQIKRSFALLEANAVRSPTTPASPLPGSLGLYNGRR